MTRILRWFADHPTAANLLMLLFFFLGAVSAPRLLRETFPDHDATEVETRVLWPGASAEDVEEAVCRRVEDALESVTGVEEVRSDAREGVGVVVAEMREGRDYLAFLTDVKTEVEAIDDFPEDAEDPVVRELGRTELVVAVAVTGPMSEPDLKTCAEELKDRMQRLPMISEVEILGFSDRQIQIQVPAAALKAHGLSVQDVAAAVASQSVDMPGGVIENHEEEVMLRFTDQRRTVPEYEDLVVVSSATGAEVRLGDIAEITDSFELAEDKIVFNGRRGAMLQVTKTEDQDALEVLAAVRDFLDKERLASAPTVELTLTRNVSKIVRDRLSMLVDNGAQGLALVFLVMWLFFAFRFSFWVSMGLPASFAGALFAMHLAGFSLNMLTMVGLLLALGLIMDDAIVLSENVMTHLRRGKSSLDAAVDGVAEVAPGVFASFVTTLAVFGSLAALVAGDIGKVLWVLPVVLIMTLGVSLAEAFLILPSHLAHALRGKEDKAPGRFRQGFERRLEWAREHVVGRIADWCVRRRYLFLGLAVAALMGSVSLLAGGVVKTSAFPDIEGDVLEARLLLPQGTPLSRTEEVAGRITDGLDAVNEHFKPVQPEQRDLVENVNVQYSVNRDAKETGPHMATITADLLSAEVRNAAMDDIRARWREAVGRVPGVVSLVYSEPALGPEGRAIEIRLVGEDLHELDAASRELMDALAGFRGVFDLQDDLRPGMRELRLTLKHGASALGLDARKLARQIRAAFHGVTADEIQVGPESYEIDVSLAPEDQNSLAILDTFTITGPDGGQIPLKAVADIEQGRGWSRIARIDGRRAVTVFGDVDTRIANANQIVDEVKRTVLPDILERHPGVEADFEGQEAAGRETGRSMLLALVSGLFGVFLLLSLQFKSYLEPLAVMAVIPMTLIGVILGHLALGYDVSMVSIMGFISLSGIVVNDSILLVEFLRRNVEQGMEVPEAAKQASRERFRAVLLTSLTTMAGMLPLLLEQSLQAQVLIPLVVSIVFGLAASTLLVLFLVPSLYSIFEDLGWTRKTH
jgi:multidrug efflux pump subunit AcrB